MHKILTAIALLCIALAGLAGVLGFIAFCIR
jgi:hypothetical protein